MLDLLRKLMRVGLKPSQDCRLSVELEMEIAEIKAELADTKKSLESYELQSGELKVELDEALDELEITNTKLYNLKRQISAILEV